MNLETNRLINGEKVFLAILLPVLFLSYFLNLGLQPIFMEEPRRALVAMEMILNNNYWVPTEFGEAYYNKPPLYNWMLCGIFNLTGSFSELNVRVVSVVSFLLLGLLHFFFTRKYMGTRFALLSSLLLLVTVDIYFYFSLTGEIDLFYSLIVYANIAVIYYFQDRREYYAMFILAYFIAALGMLTKSFPSVAFLGISLLLVLWLKKDLRKLFSLAHAAGIIVFAMVLGTYLYMYSRMHDLNELLTGLWVDSSKRTVIEGAGSNFLEHLVTFPLEVLKNLLPSALLLVFAFRKSLLMKIRKNHFVYFSLLAFFFNAIIYWISPEARQRYIYALYPFLINVFLFLYLDYNRSWKEKYLGALTWIILIAGTILSFSMYFIPQFSGLKHMMLTSVIASLLSLMLIFLHFRKKIHPILIMIAMFVVLRLIFDMTILPLRTQDEHASVRKQDGINIARITGDKPVYLFQNSHISNGMVYYIVKETMKPVNREYDPELPGYFIIEENYFGEYDYETYYESELRGVRFRLVKFDKLTTDYTN